MVLSRCVSPSLVDAEYDEVNPSAVSWITLQKPVSEPRVIPGISLPHRWYEFESSDDKNSRRRNVPAMAAPLVDAPQ